MSLFWDSLNIMFYKFFLFVFPFTIYGFRGSFITLSAAYTYMLLQT